MVQSPCPNCAAVMAALDKHGVVYELIDDE